MARKMSLPRRFIIAAFALHACSAVLAGENSAKQERFERLSASQVDAMEREAEQGRMKSIGEVDVWGRGIATNAPNRRIDMSKIVRPQARREALSAAVLNTVSSPDFRNIVEGR